MIRALLGGSFDPFHRGHAALVNTTLSRRLAAHVLVVPAFRSPHKPPPVVGGQHRYRMAQLALAGLPSVMVSPLELERGGTSYTVDTLEELAGQAAGDSWRLILGADNLRDFHRWRAPQRILELAELLVFARSRCADPLPAVIAKRAQLVEDFQVPISSTAVRARLAAGERPVDWVSTPVLDYIREHGLYGVEGKETPCP
jgi:nicotinate-nucleotide adenylyltransferase